MRFPKKIQFHDVTLRDREQQANLVFRKQEKIKIAQLLDATGVDRIEAGMPSVSEEDAEAIKTITGMGLSAKIFCLARCVKQDVDNALKCDVDGVQMEIPTSETLLKNAYGWTVQKALDLTVESTSWEVVSNANVSLFTPRIAHCKTLESGDNSYFVFLGQTLSVCCHSRQRFHHATNARYPRKS